MLQQDQGLYPSTAVMRLECLPRAGMVRGSITAKQTTWYHVQTWYHVPGIILRRIKTSLSRVNEGGVNC